MAQHTIHFSEIHTMRVAAGDMRCTIRAPRKRPIAVGFAGRGKAHPQAARLLRTATCVGVNEIILHFARDHSVEAIDISGPVFDGPTPLYRWTASPTRSSAPTWSSTFS